ncbi:MAG: shikimate kinase [Bacteroidetes bacterium]|nr:shikimate kinase [Bacteroidota bacterium]
MKIIFLIGMPFAGKSYWARKLSQHYNIPIADTDKIIESESGKSIAKIFETEGENAFRKMEQNTLDKLIAEHNEGLIVACGGGTPVFFDNMAKMKNAGCVIYLEANIITLTSRFESAEEKNNRPLLASLTDVEEGLLDLLDDRKNIYEQADYVLSVEGLSITNFDKIISECISKQY